jgi:hypothetical protein
MGEHNLTGGVRPYQGQEAYDAMVKEIKAAYDAADFPETIRLIDRHFGNTSYSLGSLFKDEQRRILGEILASTRQDLEHRFRLITERYEPLMRFLQTTGVPMPSALRTASDFVLHADLWSQIHAESLDLPALRPLLREAQNRGDRVLDEDLRFACKNRMEQMIQRIAEQPEDKDQVRLLEQFTEVVSPLSLGMSLWKVQNTYWELLRKVGPSFKERAEHGDTAALEWVAEFSKLGDRLGFSVHQLQLAQPVQMAA